MKVYLETEKEEKNIPFQGKAQDLLKELDVNPEEVLVIKNEEIITLEETLEDGDEIKILSVVSGG